MPVLVPVSKAGEHKTIEQRERASRDARRWRNRGIRTASGGAGLTALVPAVKFGLPPMQGHKPLDQQLSDIWHQPEWKGMTAAGLPHYGPRSLKSKLARVGRRYYTSLDPVDRATHGLGGAMLAGGLGTAAAMHGVSRHHEHKIAQRRKANLRSKQPSAKETVRKLSGYDTSTGTANRVGYKKNPRGGLNRLSEQEIEQRVGEHEARAKHQIRHLPLKVGIAAGLGQGLLIGSPWGGQKTRLAVAGGTGLAAYGGAKYLSNRAIQRSKKIRRTLLAGDKEPRSLQVWQHKEKQSGKTDYRDEYDRPVSGAYEEFYRGKTRKRIAKSEYELVSKPFTTAQIRAIAAEKTRQTGDSKAVGRYMHNLKQKTLKHHAQWGGTSVTKKLVPTGLHGAGVAKGYKKHREDRADRWLNEFYEDQGKPSPPPQPSRSSRYDYEPGRQRRLGGGVYLAGAGGTGLVGYGLHRSAKETWHGASKPIKEEPGKLRPALIPKDWYRSRLRNTTGGRKAMIVRAQPKHLAALVGGGVLIAGARKLHHQARTNDREWY